MNRRHWLATAAFSTLLLPTAVRGQIIDGRVTLRERLRAGLLCRRPEEFTFADHIADLVEQRVLSAEMVLGTMKWAVERRPDFPFYYFKEAIKLRAKSVGVTI